MTEVVGAQRMQGMIRPLKARQAPLSIVLYVYIAGEAALAIANALEYYFRTAQGIDPYYDLGAMSSAFALALLVAGLAQLGGLLASVVLVCMWTFRAMKNLHIVRAPAATMSPGWAVGWYFIPFANLWKPLEGMLQIWRESHRLAGKPDRVAAYVGWWWATWIISNILANISLRLTGFAEPLPTYDVGLLVATLGGGLSVICGLLLLRTTEQITKAQAEMGDGGLANTFS